MDAMLALLPEDVPPNRLFLAVFLCFLPEDMRNHLAAQDLSTPEAMAADASRLYDAQPQGVTVATMATRPNSSNGSRSPSRQGCQGRDRRRRQTPGHQSSKPATNGLCFYHDSFGAKAVKCRLPCLWLGNGQLANGFGN
jgi:hypothetical protein